MFLIHHGRTDTSASADLGHRADEETLTVTLSTSPFIITTITGTPGEVTTISFIPAETTIITFPAEATAA